MFNEATQTHTWVFDGTGIQSTSASNQWWYGIRYRPIGGTDWAVKYDYKYIDNDHPGLKFDFRIPGLEPCTTYEFQLACEACVFVVSQIPAPAVPINCKFNLDHQLADGKVSQIFTVNVPGPASHTNPITNFQVVSAPTSHSFDLSWDAVPSAAYYSVELSSANGCEVQQTVYSNAATIQAPSAPACEAACLDYTLRVKAFSPCGATTSVAASPALHIHFGDCVAYVSEVVPAGQQALVNWKALRGNPDGFDLHWWKKSDPDQVFSATGAASETQVILTDLAPADAYTVELAMHCSGTATGGAATSCTATQDFATTCDAHEPNNTPETAVAIPFGVVVNSAISNGDMDYFRFQPTCAAIWVDAPQNIGFRILQNGVEVKKEGLDNLDGLVSTYHYYYPVVPYSEYLIQFYSFNTTPQACYAFKVRNANNWYNIASDMQGDFTVTLENAPETREYSIGNTLPFSVDWTMSGPARIIADDGDHITAYFGHIGYASLTATITNCEGGIREITKNIVIESPGGMNKPLIYPNPVMQGTKLRIWLPALDYGEKPFIKIFDAQGKMMAAFGDDKTLYEFETSGLPASLYFVQIALDGKIEQMKFLVIE